MAIACELKQELERYVADGHVQIEHWYPSDERTLQHEVAWGPKEVPYGPACGCRQTRTLA